MTRLYRCSPKGQPYLCASVCLLLDISNPPPNLHFRIQMCAVFRGHIWTRPLCKSILPWRYRKETRTYIRPVVEQLGSYSGHHGICASSPHQVIGLEWPSPSQVLKKLVSPVAPWLAALASRWKSLFEVSVVLRLRVCTLVHVQSATR